MSFIRRPTVTLIACYIYKRLLIMCFHHQTQKYFLLATSIFPNSTGTPTVPLLIHPTLLCYQILYKLIHDNFLFQLVKDPTRNGNILDLVFVLSFDLVYDLKVGLPFSDHNSISVLLSRKPSPGGKSQKLSYSFKEADWDHLRNLLHYTPWHWILT